MKKMYFFMCLSLLATVVFAQKKYHDAAMFNVPNGRVNYIEYKSGRVCFSEDGRIDKQKSSYLSLYSKYKIERDKDGYPVTLVTEFDKTLFEYDTKKRIAKRTVVANNATMIFMYNYEGTNVSITRIESEAGQPKKIKLFLT